MDKFFLTSKRVQGALAAVIGLILSQAGLDLGDAETTALAGNILTVAGTVWHLYGQYTKSKPLRLRLKGKK